MKQQTLSMSLSVLVFAFSTACSKMGAADHGSVKETKHTLKLQNGPNDPFVVWLDNPPSDGTVAIGTRLNVTVMARGPAKLYRGDIYINGQWVCGDYDLPYNCDYTFDKEGAYEIQGTAYNEEDVPGYPKGSAHHSEIVVIKVMPKSPETSIKLNLADLALKVGTKLNLTADAQAPSGVYRIDFHVNGKLACADYDMPFNCEHTFDALGAYEVQAIAYSNSTVDAPRGVQTSEKFTVKAVVDLP